MGRGPDGTIRYLDLHLARLSQGAARLGYAFDRAYVLASLAGIAEGSQRIRLTMDDAGRVEVTTGPLPPNPPHWQVTIAEPRLRSDDPWLRIKTTNRSLYNEAREMLPTGVDEWLFLNERGEVCEGTITNIFVITAEGRRLTPALSCGLLPGVLRAGLLLDGWEEAVLTPEDLRDAREIFMGNALRGLIPVHLTPFA